MSTSQVQIIMPPHVNGTHRLFGGQLMSWIDVVAAVEARRHSRSQVTTIEVDHLQFLSPAFLDEYIRLDAQITWTGRTSMEVRVDSYVEPLSGEERLINRAYLVFVAIDMSGNPCAVPEFIPVTEQEQYEWQQAQLRREQRLSARSADVPSLRGKSGK